MARTLLDYCISEQTEPAVKVGVKEQAPVLPSAVQEVVVAKPRKRQRQPYPPICPENLPPSYFVSATYDGRQKKVVIKLYEPNSGQIYFWYDNTNHKPYCLTNLTPEELKHFNRITDLEGFDRFQQEEKIDPLSDKIINVTKIIAKDPSSIGGQHGITIRDIIPWDYSKVFGIQFKDSDTKIWESKIKYYQSYIYDQQLLPGMLYEVKEKRLVLAIDDSANENLNKIRALFTDCSEEEREYIEMWAKLLEYPAPIFRRAAIDIEVLSSVVSRMPNPEKATDKVIAVSVYSSDGEKKVFILKRDGKQENNKPSSGDCIIEYFEKEEDLLRKTFEALEEYPFILTFNGDDFDLRYLSNRALKPTY